MREEAAPREVTRKAQGSGAPRKSGSCLIRRIRNTILVAEIEGPDPEGAKGGCRACTGNGPGISREGAAASWTRAWQVAFEALVLLFFRAGKWGGDAR